MQVSGKFKDILPEIEEYMGEVYERRKQMGLMD